MKYKNVEKWNEIKAQKNKEIELEFIQKNKSRMGQRYLHTEISKACKKVKSKS